MRGRFGSVPLGKSAIRRETVTRSNELWFCGGNQRRNPDEVDGAAQVVGQGGQAELAAHVL